MSQSPELRRMAEEAGLRLGPCDKERSWTRNSLDEMLEAFARLVAEDCAKIAMGLETGVGAGVHISLKYALKP